MQKTKRLLALDVIRGLTIALMVVVNNAGDFSHVYAPLKHSHWNGCTPTDLVFPFFLFIMGSAMWYSFRKFDHKLTKPAVIKVLRRALIIYLIGIAINMYATFSLDLSHLRIMGVMNRIGVAYAIASFIILGLHDRNMKIVTGIILLGYWALLVFFGGDHPFTLEGNFAGRFDRFVLGANHLQGLRGTAFDQTGLLSTLPSVANVLFGYMAGRLTDVRGDKRIAVKQLVLYGMAGVLIGRVWDLAFPINKLLWTSSYVVYSSGLAALLLGIFLWIIDIKGYQKWTHPFQVFGKNPLLIYAFSQFVAITLWIRIAHSSSGDPVSIQQWIFLHLFKPVAAGELGSLFYALNFGLLCWLMGWILYKRQVFVKI